MKKLLLLAILALLAIASFQIWITKDRTGQMHEMEKADIARETKTETPIGGAFTLVDQNSKTVHDTDFRGHVMLVFFGFTHCPDICPVTVAVLSKTMELLEASAEQVTPLFISIDPERDTPAALKEFLANFDKRIVGLTGTQEQVKAAADAYKTYYAKAAEESPDAAAKGDYTVDHSGYIYVMGKDGRFIRVFPYNVSEQELAGAVESALK